MAYAKGQSGAVDIYLSEGDHKMIDWSAIVAAISDAGGKRTDPEPRARWAGAPSIKLAAWVAVPPIISWVVLNM